MPPCMRTDSCCQSNNSVWEMCTPLPLLFPSLTPKPNATGRSSCLTHGLDCSLRCQSHRIDCTTQSGASSAVRFIAMSVSQTLIWAWAVGTHTVWWSGSPRRLDLKPTLSLPDSVWKRTQVTVIWIFSITVRNWEHRLAAAPTAAGS